MRAVISVDEYGDLLLEEVFSGVGFITKYKEKFGICMRDSGYEFSYGGKWYSAQKGVITEMGSDDSTDSHPEGTFGKNYRIPFPFRRDTFSQVVLEEGGVRVIEKEVWTPGLSGELARTGEAVADGQGYQIITVVGSYKPGKYPERIFFTQQWEDPYGKVFGKTKLHIKSAYAFGVMVSGYRYPYRVLFTGGARDAMQGGEDGQQEGREA